MSQTDPEILARQRRTERESTPARETGDVEWRKALELWLRWNDEHEKIASQICENGTEQQLFENCMDQLERMRREAVSLSEQLID